MAGKQSYVEFRSSKSTVQKNKLRLPQGGVLSPLLFNSYLSKLPTSSPELKLSYIDDITILETGRDIQVLEDILNDYLPMLKSFLKDQKFKLSTPKSTVTIFTTWTKEVKDNKISL